MVVSLKYNNSDCPEHPVEDSVTAQSYTWCTLYKEGSASAAGGALPWHGGADVYIKLDADYATLLDDYDRDAGKCISRIGGADDSTAAGDVSDLAL